MKSKSDSSFEEVIFAIMKANAEALSVKDPETQLYPFIVAAAIDNLNLSYQLLLESPSVVRFESDTSMNDIFS